MTNNMSIDIKIEKFDVGTVPPDSVVLFIGKRNTGKSIAAQHFARHFRWIPRGVVCCPTEATNPTWTRHVPSCYVKSKFDEEHIKKLMVDQILLRKKLEREIREKEGREMTKYDLPCAFCILDDCSFDPKFKKSKVLRELLANGRHLNILVFIMIQYIMHVNPDIRSNSDFVVLTVEKTEAVRKKIYENWGSCVPTKDLFTQAMRTTTRDHGCMVIDNKNNNSLDWTDSIFRFKADYRYATAPFRMGNEKFWAFARIAQKSESEMSPDEIMKVLFGDNENGADYSKAASRHAEEEDNDDNEAKPDLSQIDHNKKLRVNFLIDDDD